MDYLEALQKRYSVKKFNTEKIPAEIFSRILNAGKLAASSLGLQPYQIYIVESAAAKESLIPAFYNPLQVATCSHLIVIAAKKEINENYLQGYFTHIADVRSLEVEKLSGFRKSIHNYVHSLDDKDVLNWTEKQCYIVLANLMFAAALENVDTCPLEGFIPEKLGELLDLDAASEKAAVVLTLGYRAEDDVYQHNKKVRKPDEKLFHYK